MVTYSISNPSQEKIREVITKLPFEFVEEGYISFAADGIIPPEEKYDENYELKETKKYIELCQKNEIIPFSTTKIGFFREDRQCPENHANIKTDFGYREVNPEINKKWFSRSFPNPAKKEEEENRIKHKRKSISDFVQGKRINEILLQVNNREEMNEVLPSFTNKNYLINGAWFDMIQKRGYKGLGHTECTINYEIEYDVPEITLEMNEFRLEKEEMKTLENWFESIKE